MGLLTRNTQNARQDDVSYFEHHVLPPAAVGTAGFVGVQDAEDGEGGGIIRLDGLWVSGGKEGGRRDEGWKKLPTRYQERGSQGVKNRATQYRPTYLNVTQRASIDVAAHGVRACVWFGGGSRRGV